MPAEVAIQFNLNDPRHYRLFIEVKALPRFRFVGRTALIPAEYADRLKIGHRAEPANLPYVPIDGLFDYQRDISSLAIRKRKFAVFLECGYGKSLILLEFARHAAKLIAPNECILIVSPLMVISQTLAEAAKFYGDTLAVEHVRAKDLQSWLDSGTSRIGITNYEALKDDLRPGRLAGLVADESSTLKSSYGKWGNTLIRLGKGLEWKLALTGTPAPNDRIEYANHAVFLDAFPTVNSFLARFFVNRGQTSERWEMKPHAIGPFYKALSHFSIFVTDPGTYGWKDNAGSLPPIHIHIHDVELTDEQRSLTSEHTGMLFANELGGITGRSKLGQIAKGRYKGKDVATLKPDYIRRLVDSWSDRESTIVWCCKPDAPVTLANGTEARIADISPGDMVLSGSGQPRAVLNRLQRHHVGDMVRIKIRGLCDRLELTPEHRLPTSDGWKTAGEVAVGDWLIDGTFLPPEDGGDYELGWIVGLYAAEGCRVRGPNGKQNTTKLGVHDNEADYVVNRMKNFCTSPINVYGAYNGGRCTTIVTSDANFRSVVDSWVGGETCYSKHLLQLPRHRGMLQGVLEGWLYGDGSRQAKAIIGQSSSRNLARQMLLIASSLGYSASMTTGMNRAGPVGRSMGIKSSGMPWWRVGVSRRVGHYAQSRFVDGITYRQVASVEREAYDGEVYDLTVDVDHTFIVNGIVVSNCIYNNEQELMEKAFPDAVSLKGSTPYEKRAAMIDDFKAGRNRICISKAEVMGFGLNLQIATRHVFSGIHDSFENWHQCIKRSNRVGSKYDLNVHVPVTELERPMLDTVLRKARRIDEDTREQERLFKDCAKDFLDFSHAI